jgi:hypothetical protein
MDETTQQLFILDYNLSVTEHAWLHVTAAMKYQGQHGLKLALQEVKTLP